MSSSYPKIKRNATQRAFYLCTSSLMMISRDGVRAWCRGWIYDANMEVYLLVNILSLCYHFLISQYPWPNHNFSWCHQTVSAFSLFFSFFRWNSLENTDKKTLYIRVLDVRNLYSMAFAPWTHNSYKKCLYRYDSSVLPSNVFSIDAYIHGFFSVGCYYQINASENQTYKSHYHQKYMHTQLYT